MNNNKSELNRNISIFNSSLSGKKLDKRNECTDFCAVRLLNFLKLAIILYKKDFFEHGINDFIKFFNDCESDNADFIYERFLKKFRYKNKNYNSNDLENGKTNIFSILFNWVKKLDYYNYISIDSFNELISKLKIISFDNSPYDKYIIYKLLNGNNSLPHLLYYLSRYDAGRQSDETNKNIKNIADYIKEKYLNTDADMHYNSIILTNINIDKLPNNINIKYFPNLTGKNHIENTFLRELIDSLNNRNNN